MALPAVAYFFRDWRSLQLVLCTPAIFQILVCWMIPESPRWLLRKGRDAEAEALLRALAKGNGRRKHLPAKFGELVQKVGRLEQVVFLVHWKHEQLKVRINDSNRKRPSASPWNRLDRPGGVD